MQEIIKRAECYIKGEESNAEKRSRDARERESQSTRGIEPQIFIHLDDASKITEDMRPKGNHITNK
jgi:hypothetical protein